MAPVLTDKQLARVDHLLHRLTAVESLAAFRAMQAGGYVPTVSQARSKRHRELVRLLRAAGVRVWTGSNDPR